MNQGSDNSVDPGIPSTIHAWGIPANSTKEDVKKYFEESLRCRVRSVRLVRDKSAKSSKQAAVIDLGQEEYVGQAFREMNYQFWGSERLKISRYISDHLPTGAKTVNFDGLDLCVEPGDLYDHLSKYGTVVSIDIDDSTAEQKLGVVRSATFRTEGSAENARAEINKIRGKGGAFKTTVRPPRANKRVGRRKAGTSVDAVKAAVPTPDVPSSVAPHTKSKQGSVAGADGGNEVMHSSSVGPDELAHLISLAMGTPIDKRNQVIGDYIVEKYQGKFETPMLRAFVAIVTSSLTWSELMNLAADESVFLMCWNNALENLDLGFRGIRALGNDQIQLRLDLGIDLLPDIQARKDSLLKYLVLKYSNEQCIGSDNLDTVCMLLAAHLRTQDLLDVALDPKLFQLYVAFFREVEKIPDDYVFACGIDLEQVHLLELDHDEDIAQRKLSLRRRLQMLQQRPVIPSHQNDPPNSVVSGLNKGVRMVRQWFHQVLEVPK